MAPQKSDAKKAPAKKKKGRKPRTASSDLPTREQLIEFISESTGKVGKREIARAFGITGAARIPLKRMIKELTAEGHIQPETGRKLRRPGALPSVTVLNIVRHDTHGDLIANPANWDGEGDAPDIVFMADRKKAGARLGAVGVGDRILARIAKTDEGDTYPYQAKLIKRIGKGRDTILGIFRASPDGGRIIPVEKRARDELIVERGNTGEAKDGDLVVAETLPGPRFGLKRARIRDTHGPGGGQESISLIAIHAHGIPDAFPEGTLKAAEKIKPTSLGERTDLRELPLITIDPADARDHDDAVWATPDPNPKNQGGWIVWVAIADVATYVHPDDALDREARKRGNSTYFPDRVVPMLPERISNNLCSLREGEDRPCMAVKMTFDKNGIKKTHEFVRALMRSAAALTYQQVQTAIDGTPDEKTSPLMDQVIIPLWGAYQALAKERDKRAPLDLDLPEHKITLTKAGKVKSISPAPRYDSMRLIEEFMIQANVAAAETLEAKRSPVMYRVHDAPSREKLLAFADFLNTLGISFTKGQTVRPSHFNRILEQVRDGENAQMVSSVVLRSQAQAEYTPENLGHFGLNLRRYAHFTSPIRRYADLIVHRALITALKLGKGGLTKSEIGELENIAEHISDTERRSMLAERDSTDRYVASYLAGSIGNTFTGRISGVTRFGLFVRLDDTGADGIVPISSLGGDFFHHDEAAHTLVGERTGLTYRIGEPVSVRLEEATPITGGLRFELIEGGNAGKPSRRPRPASKNQAKRPKRNRRK